MAGGRSLCSGASTSGDRGTQLPLDEVTWDLRNATDKCSRDAFCRLSQACIHAQGTEDGTVPGSRGAGCTGRACRPPIPHALLLPKQADGLHAGTGRAESMQGPQPLHPGTSRKTQASLTGVWLRPSCYSSWQVGQNQAQEEGSDFGFSLVLLRIEPRTFELS